MPNHFSRNDHPYDLEQRFGLQPLEDAQFSEWRENLPVLAEEQQRLNGSSQLPTWQAISTRKY